jgi:hypothetical protein
MRDRVENGIRCANRAREIKKSPQAITPDAQAGQQPQTVPVALGKPFDPVAGGRGERRHQHRPAALRREGGFGARLAGVPQVEQAGSGVPADQ